MALNQVTPSQVQKIVTAAVEPILQLVEGLKSFGSGKPADDVVKPEVVSSGATIMTGVKRWDPYVWGGSFHAVPEHFVLPDGHVLAAWQAWLVGDENQNYPPIRRLTSNDMSTDNKRKRLRYD